MDSYDIKFYNTKKYIFLHFFLFIFYSSVYTVSLKCGIVWSGPISEWSFSVSYEGKFSTSKEGINSETESTVANFFAKVMIRVNEARTGFFRN